MALDHDGVSIDHGIWILHVTRATNNAVEYLHTAIDNIKVNTARSIGNQIPDSDPSYLIQTLGENSYNFLVGHSDVPFRNFAIDIIPREDPEKRQTLMKYLEIALKTQAISPDASYLIENEPNIHKAIQLFIVKSRQWQQHQAEMKQQDILMNAKAQQESNAQTAENERAMKELEAQIDINKELTLSQIRKAEANEAVLGQILLARAQNKLDMTAQEEELLNKLIIAREKNETDLKQTKILAAAKDTQTIKGNMKRE